MPTLQATQTEFKVGDPALYEFKQVTVEKVEGGSPTSVRDDYFSYGIGRANVFPVTERGLEITRFFAFHYDHLHRIDGEVGVFNWPDIAGYLHTRFNRAMFALMNGDEEGVAKETTEVNGFVSLATDYRARVKSINVHGVYLIGRR